MMTDKLDREVKVLLIFLEHPGGLGFVELWNIVQKQKICAKGTLKKMLDTWMGQGIIEKNELGRYTLGLTEPVAQLIKKGEYELPKQVESFLETLYKGYEQTGKKQAELFAQLAISYLGKRLRQMILTTWLLFPFLYDSKVREIWFQGHKYALIILLDKSDEISQKFYKTKISHAFRIDSVQEKFMIPQLELLTRRIKLENQKIADLMDQLDIEDELKRKLTSQLVSEPFLDVLVKEYEAFAKVIRAFMEME